MSTKIENAPKLKEDEETKNNDTISSEEENSENGDGDQNDSPKNNLASFVTTPYERVLSIINEAKAFILSVSSTQQNLINGLEWAIKIISSHNLYTYEFKEHEDTEDFKQFVQFVNSYNDVIPTNKKPTGKKSFLTSSLDLKRPSALKYAINIPIHNQIQKIEEEKNDEQSSDIINNEKIKDNPINIKKDNKDKNNKMVLNTDTNVKIKEIKNKILNKNNSEINKKNENKNNIKNKFMKNAYTKLVKNIKFLATKKNENSENLENQEQPKAQNVSISSSQEQEQEQENKPKTCKEKVADAIITKVEVEKNRTVFLSLLSIGCFLVCISLMMLPLVITSPSKFSMSLAFGSSFLLVSFLFYYGTKNYVLKLFDKKRFLLSLLFISSIILAIVFWFIDNYFLSLLSSIFQVFCLVLFGLTFIPGGQGGIKYIKNKISSPFVKIFMNVAKREITNS